MSIESTFDKVISKQIPDKANGTSEMIRERLVTVVSHEFRTPLAIILATASFLERADDQLNAQERQVRLNKIQNVVRHMNHLVDKILIRENLQLPQSIYLEPFTIRHIVAIIERISLESSRQADFVLSYSNETALIKGNEELYRWILSNIIENSLLYSLVGSPITIDVTLKNGHLLISVADQGMGIPEEDLPHIFQPYFRGGNVLTISGLGMGLTMANLSVERLNGHIEVTRGVDGGTICLITIPNVSKDDGRSI